MYWEKNQTFNLHRTVRHRECEFKWRYMTVSYFKKSCLKLFFQNISEIISSLRKVKWASLMKKKVFHDKFSKGQQVKYAYFRLYDVRLDQLFRLFGLSTKEEKGKFHYFLELNSFNFLFGNTLIHEMLRKSKMKIFPPKLISKRLGVILR